ncbi:sulfotransferase domain-containing protein [Sphingobium bisphenolivorans]|uniref:sulfotransferase domain-containing protein n=1 Tax=Sphingobium bisphenolivorans TaxID=1335760 RepID=UPI00126A03D6|nr:sulfotransferase domain-containing protein [Sphingobium bisphenolivorans]
MQHTNLDGMPPPIVLCAGLPRSSSTWLYNVVISLYRTKYEVTGIFSDIYLEDFDNFDFYKRKLVIKSHSPSKELVDYVISRNGKIFASVRDPRDCVVSLMQAFKFTKEQAISMLEHSCDAIYSTLSSQCDFILRYEDYVDKSDIVVNLARELSCELSEQCAHAIAADFSASKVRSEIATLEAQGIINSSNPAESWTKESHWHPNHIGDGKVGKYIDELSDLDNFIISKKNRELMNSFNYNTSDYLTNSTLIDFGKCRYIEKCHGFSFSEDWGVWTDGSSAHLELRYLPTIHSIRLEILLFLGPSLQGENPQGKGYLEINGVEVMHFPTLCSPVSEILIVHNIIPDEGFINIDFHFFNLKSPKELEISDDDRKLGLGLRQIYCNLEA